MCSFLKAFFFKEITQTVVEAEIPMADMTDSHPTEGKHSGTGRKMQQPIWTRDYVMKSHNNEFQPHYYFLSKIMQIKDPQTYKEAATNPNWVKAMNDEIQA